MTTPHDFDDDPDDRGADYDEDLDELELTYEMPPDSLGGSSHVRTRDDALDAGLPLLLLHRGAAYHKELAELVDQIHATESASLSLGVVVNLPRDTAAVAASWLAGPSGASVRIADPELYSRPDMWGPALLLERDGPPKTNEAGQLEPGRPLMPQRSASWDYWTHPLPAGATEDWVVEVLDAQRAAGANLLLTPGTPLDEHNPGLALQELQQQAGWARTALGGTERMAVNVTIDSPWLSSPTLRTKLLNVMVEMPDKTWYVRVKWPSQASYSQLADAGVLDGYRELSAFMEDEARTLLLPTSGGTGWVSLAWGATGFGTGMSNSARGFWTNRAIRRKNPTPAPPRYYERPLLHSVEKTTSDNLARIPGYRACSCVYCTRLRGQVTWESRLGNAHHVLATAAETAALAVSGRRSAARRMVRDAEQVRDKVTRIVPLIDRDAPTHLGLWSRLLQ